MHICTYFFLYNFCLHVQEKHLLGLFLLLNFSYISAGILSMKFTTEITTLAKSVFDIFNYLGRFMQLNFGKIDIIFIL